MAFGGTHGKSTGYILLIEIEDLNKMTSVWTLQSINLIHHAIDSNGCCTLKSGVSQGHCPDSVLPRVVARGGDVAYYSLSDRLRRPQPSPHPCAGQTTTSAPILAAKATTNFLQPRYLWCLRTCWKVPWKLGQSQAGFGAYCTRVRHHAPGRVDGRAPCHDPDPLPPLQSASDHPSRATSHVILPTSPHTSFPLLACFPPQ